MQTAHSTPHNATHSNADPHEIARFAQLANQWWNPQGALHALHAITPCACNGLHRTPRWLAAKC